MRPGALTTLRRGPPGHAIEIPLGDTLDQLEQRLRDHQPVAADRGVLVEHYQIFLDVHQGYQDCPYTITRPPRTLAHPRTRSVATTPLDAAEMWGGSRRATVPRVVQ